MERRPSGSEPITRGITLLCFLLPLTFFPGLMALYRLPKTTLFAFFTAVLCWLWAGNQFRQRREGISPLPLIVPLLAYLFIGALSLFRSINPYEGANFLFQTILGISLFWITSTHFETERLTKFFHWSVIAASAVSVLGIAQAWGADIPTLIAVSGPGSTFGNKNMAAQYLLFVLPAAFYLLLSSTQAVREWIYAILIGLVATYFVYTGARAAWGGVLVGLITVFACLPSSERTQLACSLSNRKLAFLSGISFFVVVMNVVPPYLFPGFGAQRALTRLESMLEVQTQGRDRFAIWANTLAIYADHPILGAGKGNFRFIYPVYARRVVEDQSFSPVSRAADAHNDYIQLLAETGVLGTASFLLILALVAVKFWRGLRRELDHRLLVVGVALVAILGEAFWDFPFNLPVPVAFFWIYAGILWRLTRTDVPRQDRQPAKVFSAVAVALLVLLATLFSVLTLSYLRAEFYYSRGARESHQGRLEEAEKNFTKATTTSPLNDRYHSVLGLLLIRMKQYDKAAGHIRRSLSLNPYNINALNNLGVAYASAGNTAKAVQAFQTALRIWPRYIEPQKSLGFIYAREGEREKAIRHFQAALALDSSDRQARDSLLALGAVPPGK